MNTAGNKLLFYIIGISFVLCISIIFKQYNLLVYGLIALILISISISKSIERVYVHAAFVFGVGLVVAALIYYGYMQEYGRPYYIGGSDDYEYEQWAEYAIQKHLYIPEQMAADELLCTHNSKGFVWIMSWFVRLGNLLGGYHTFAYRMFNIAFLTIIGILVYKYFQRYERSNQKNSLLVFYALSLFPNALYLSSHVFRDTLSTLLLFMIFFVWRVQIEEEKVSIKAVIGTLILSYCAFWIRSQNVIYIITFILILFVVGKKRLNTIRLMKAFPFVLFVLVMFFAFDVNQDLMNKSELYSNNILRVNDGLSRTVFSIPLLPFGLIVRILYSLIFPPPVALIQLFGGLSWIRAIDAFIAIGIVFQIYMIPYIIRGVKKWDSIAIIFVTVLLSVCISTFTFRHFIMLYPFMAIMIIREYEETTKSKRSMTMALMTTVLVFGVCMYV